MKKGKNTLLITDVTRMGGHRVCVAGINSEGNSIRPMIENSHITEDWLYDGSEVTIYPFSLVTFNFLGHRPSPPHSEDWIIDPDFKEKAGSTNAKKKKTLLREYSDENVSSIFGADIHHDPGYYIRPGEGNRSLGTIEADITDFFHGIYFNKLDYRVTFLDSAKQEFSLKVTDLSFRYYCHYLNDKKGLSTDKISAHLKEQLLSSKTYLRIGLARPWDDQPDCCFLQITGVYTFPDYLDGNCFADFYRP